MKNFSAPAPMAGKAFSIRAAAYLTDMLILVIGKFIVATLVSFLVGAVLIATGRKFSMVEPPPQDINLLYGVVSLFLYYLTFEWLCWASLGKLVLGLRVVKKDGTPCDVVTALIRGLLRFIDGLFLGLPAYFSMQAPLYQRLGDRAAGTLVVSAKEPSIQPVPTLGWFLVAAALYLLMDAMITLFQLLPSFQIT